MSTYPGSSLAPAPSCADLEPKPMAQPVKSVHLQYMGYEQEGRVRSYHFDRISPGEDRQTLIVTADLALFLKHHIGIQEGPALSRQLLLAEMSGQSPGASSALHCALTDTEMLAHIASRPASSPGRGQKRAARPETAAL